MYQLPPLDDEKQFEKLIRDICRYIFKEPTFELYGKRGEGQHGIDGWHVIDSKIVAFQCKNKDQTAYRDDKLLDIVKTEMRTESLNANNFFRDKSPVKKYIFATTYKNTKHLQNYAAELTVETGMPIEYWGWQTIEEQAQKYNDILEEYFPQFLIDLGHSAGQYLRHVTKEEIEKAKIVDNQVRLYLSVNFYKINDNDEVVFKVVCNDVDIPNSKILAAAKEAIDNCSNSALWLVGDGGTGKTTLLMRLAVEYALRGQEVFHINFENAAFRSELIPEMLSFIKFRVGNRKAHIFIDNPDFDHAALENLLRDIVNYSFVFVIVFVERGIRLEQIKTDHLQYLVYGQDKTEPIKIYNDREIKTKVYKKFYELLGIKKDEVWRIIESYGINTHLAFVNATYRILYALNQNRYIDYTFDWVEFEKMAENHFPSLKDAYKYIALYYLFGIKTPFSLLSRIFSPPDSEANALLSLYGMKESEPIIIERREPSSFNYTYSLRTKHEVISELFFEEIHLDKNDLMAEIITNCNPLEFEEARSLIQLFGNKRNIQKRLLDFNKLIQFLFSNKIVHNIEKDFTLFKTIHLTKFWILYGSNQIDDAISFLEATLVKFPQDLHSRTELAKIYQRRYRLDDAERALKECLSISNNDLNSRTEIAKIYQRQGKLEEAEKVLLGLLDIDKDNLQARTELAKIYQRLDRLAEAEIVLKECLSINPKDLNSRTELAKIYQRLDRLAEAEIVLKECLSINPKDLNSRTELAKIYQRQGKLEEAEKVLMESLKIDDKQLHPRTELAKIYQRQGKLEEAEKVLMESLKIDDKQLHPRTELAKIYQRQGKLEEAEKYLKEYIELDKNGLHPRTELAKIYQRQGKLEEAEKYLKEYIELDKNGLHPRTELAKIYQRQGKLEEAEKYLKEYIELDKNGLHPRTELAKIYQRQGKLEEAEKVLLGLLDIDKDNLQARTELAKIYQRQGKLTEAEKVLLGLLDIDKDDLQARTELAKIYQRQGKLTEAEKVLMESLRINSKDCYAMAECISIYHKQSEPEKCLRMFDNFLIHLSLRKERQHQAMFNNIFKLCARFLRKDKAMEYFQNYSHVLDDQNIALYHRLFP